MAPEVVNSNQKDYIQLTRVGDVIIMFPSSEIENLPPNLIEPAAQIALSSLKSAAISNLIVDLSQVRFFGSEFIAFLLRCHLILKKSGNELVLAGVNDRIRELLRQTALDTIWAIYKTRAEAMEAVGSSD